MSSEPTSFVTQRPQRSKAKGKASALIEEEESTSDIFETEVEVEHPPQGASLKNPPPLPANTATRARAPTKQQLVESNEDLLRRLQLAEERAKQFQEDRDAARQQLSEQQRAPSLQSARSHTSPSPDRGRNANTDQTVPQRSRARDDPPDDPSGDDSSDRSDDYSRKARDHRRQRRQDNPPREHRRRNRLRVDKVPNLTEKLSDGVEPRLSVTTWKYQIEVTYRTYVDYFGSEDERRAYLLNQTEGDARQYIEPQITDPTDPNNQPTALDLVNDLYSFLYNPQTREKARNEYNRLKMQPTDSFWSFYRKFRGLSRAAKITNDDDLMFDLKSKILPRLRAPTTQEYRKARNLDAYVEALQAEDLDYDSRRQQAQEDRQHDRAPSRHPSAGQQHSRSRTPEQTPMPSIENRASSANPRFVSKPKNYTPAPYASKNAEHSSRQDSRPPRQGTPSAGYHRHQTPGINLIDEQEEDLIDFRGENLEDQASDHEHIPRAKDDV